MRRNQNSLKENNKGFTLASLLVIMLLASVLAALLLTVTVLNIQSKQVDRKSKETFYLSESIVDEIQAGIEAELGTALGIAYSEALPKLKNNATALEEEYAMRIISILFNKYTNRTYTVDYNNTYQYDINILKSYLSDKNKENRTVNLSCGNVYVDKTNYRLILKDLHIEYKTTEGYQSRMQMDFVIKVPDTRFENPGFYLTLGDYSIITDNYLTNAQGMASKINGSVYAGNGIVAKGDGSIINFVSDNIVTRKTITSETGGGINISGKDDMCKVWADTIKTSNTSSESTLPTKLTITNGKCYVKNDLVLDAKNNNYVSITGDYYGFGNNGDVPNESSAIIINGRKSTLDLTGISSMMLAGRAYIDADPSNPSNGVLMGESLSVKGNQVAYLVPGEYVRGGSNPTTNQTSLGPNDLEVDFRPKDSRKFIDSDAYKTYIDTYKAMYDGKEIEEIENGSILQYLNINNSTVGYKKIVVINNALQQETYYYLEFRSEKLANKYFSEYYKANKERIDERTRLYVDSIKLSDDLNMYTIVGNLTSYDQSSKQADVIYKEEPSNVAATCNLYSNQYKNMIYNLYESGAVNAPTENSSLFEKYIDTTELSKLTESVPEVFELDSNTKAIFINNPNNAFSIRSQFSNAYGSGIIVATGEVIVDKNFKGTIISKGEIKFSGGNELTADKYTVYQLLIPSNTSVIKYFRELSSAMASGSGNSQQKINIHELVGVENWKKY